MISPPIAGDLARDRQRELLRDAAQTRLARQARNGHTARSGILLRLIRVTWSISREEAEPACP